MSTNGPKSFLQDMPAIAAAKLAAQGSHLAGKQGTSLPGKTALAISPSVLRDLAGQVKKKIFVVCGTNGKTTTNNLLCGMLEDTGAKVICNRLGANMLWGVTGAFVEAAGLSGRLEADYACLEVDEASAPGVLSHIKPDYLILTNLFRDQLDRYGEIDITIRLLLQAIREVPEMKLIVNADDPLLVYLAQESGNPYVCYGINEPVPAAHPGHKDSKEVGTEVREGRFCKRCGALLDYSFYHFAQMGDYHCSSCEFARPTPEYTFSRISLEEGVSFAAEGRQFKTHMEGLYSIYNLLAVWSALKESGNSCERFGEVLQTARPQFGRNEIFRIGDCEIHLNLAKNPTGFNQNIEAMLEDGKPKDLIITINDNAQDGTDISWLWDVEFERIRASQIRYVTVTGIRALDMRLRLKYEEIGSQIAATPEEAIRQKLAEGTKNLYVLVNYTALFSIHQYLQRREK